MDAVWSPQYRIMRPSDDPRYVTVDLEPESVAQAEALHEALQQLWGLVQGQIIDRPQTRIFELIENTEYCFS